jgi:hypothetical protein
MMSNQMDCAGLSHTLENAMQMTSRIKSIVKYS